MLATRLRRFAVVLVAALLARPALAQTGAIAGKITDTGTGSPIVAARVAAQVGIDRPAGAANSRDDGSYRIINLPPGTYAVIVTRIGFAVKRTENVRVTAGGTTTVDVQMTGIVTQLNPVVTTASRKEEKALDAPASIAVVDIREIQEKTSTTVADKVAGLPGVDVNKGGIVQSNVVARGFNNAFSGSILVLQDYRFAGVPSLRVNVPFLMTGTNEDVERIEVLLGPASALYGPNSANGVLHVITKSPFTSQGTTLTVDGGSRDLLRASVRHAQTFGDKVGIKLSGETFSAKDWEFTDPGEPAYVRRPLPGGQQAILPNLRDFSVRRATGEARLDIRPNDNSELVTTYGYSRIQNALELTGANGTAQARGWSYQSIQQRARVGRLFAQAYLNLNNAGNEDSLDWRGTFLLRSGQPIVDKSRVFTAQVQHGLGLWKGRQDFVYGVDYIATNPRTGGTINGRNEDIDDVKEVGAYVQSTTNLSKMFDFITALRLDNNNKIDGNQFSPRAALVFKANATNNFRATYNRAFSTPGNFSWFLDLIQVRNAGGSPYNIRALGNPPKTGWSFNRGCAAAVNDGLCMKSLFVGSNNWVPATAASALPGLINSQANALQSGITAALIAAGLPAANAGAISAGATAYLKTLTPTAAQVGSRIAFLPDPLSRNIASSQVQDLKPLGASYNETYELGYKGILGGKVRVALDLWRQKRGDVGNPAGLTTPEVYADSTTLANYLAAQLGPVLLGQVGPSLAPVLAAGIGRTVANTAKGVPLGIIQFDNDKFANAVDIYATYTTYNATVNVSGADLAVDYVASNNVTFAATLSFVDKMVFDNVISSNGLKLMLNAPDKKGTLGMRYRDEQKAWGFDWRVRYFSAYPVNSGVYASDYNFLKPSGGTYQYEAVKASTVFEAGVSKRFSIPGSREFMWTLNADNLFGTLYRTFPGSPLLGRMVTTRLQFSL
jgi:iron complex outermembrane receptor protein